MKIDTLPIGNHQVKLTVEVETEVFEEAKRNAARQIARRTKIAGFRPGKAPYQLVMRQIGEATVIEEAMGHLVEEIYPEAIKQTGIHPYGPGHLEKVVKMDPPVLEFVIPLDSEVTLGDYQSIHRPYELGATTDEDVNKSIEALRERHAVIEPVERPSQEGDIVYIKLIGKRVIVTEGEDPLLVPERSMPVVILPEKPVDPESPTEKEWPFDGFARNLLGHLVGETTTLLHTFDEATDYEPLRGKVVEFSITVEDVKSRTLPELNEEFAKTVGEFASLDELRSTVRNSLDQQTKDAYDDDYDAKILDEVIRISEIKYPPQMLEHEVDSVIESLKSRLERQKLDIDLYLKTRKVSMEDLRKEALPVAESRLKRSLILMELAKSEKIQIDDAEVKKEASQTLNVLSRTLPQKEAKRLGEPRFLNNLIGNIMVNLMTKRAMECLRDITSGKVVVELPQELTEAAETSESEALLAKTDQVQPSEDLILTEVIPAVEESVSETTSDAPETPEQV